MYAFQKHLNQLFTNRSRSRYAILKRLQSTQYDAPWIQSARQSKQLFQLLRHAYVHVPYYRELFCKNGLNPFEEAISAENARLVLSRIPILEKQTLLKQFEHLKSDDVHLRKPFLNSTGGTTGVPVSLLHDQCFYENSIANSLLVNSWRGADPFDSLIKIWGAERDTFKGRKPVDMFFRDFIRNRITLNCFTLNDSLIIKYINILNLHRPTLIIAYADSIYEIAKYAMQTGTDVLPQNAIHTGAGPLYDFMRDQIENVFSCKVFSHYGSREFGPIASECISHNGMHILTEHNIVEVVDNIGNRRPPGKEGEIIVTNLSNYSMPLIRYRIGDRGSMDCSNKCPCGCNYPKLKEVKGRDADVFLTHHKQFITPIYFRHLIGVVINCDKINQFQVIQKDYNRLRYRLSLNAPIPNDIIEQIKEKTRIVMGSDCQVEFEFVDRIEKSQTGKFRYTICEIGK